MIKSVIKMKRYFFALFILTIAQIGFSQTSGSIAKWETQTDSLQTTLEFKTTIQNGWHLYSQFLVGDGPIPTTFTFNPNDHLVLEGKVSEENAKTTYDSNFDMNISYFEGTSVFRQKINKVSDKGTIISGTIEFMVCNDHMCLPPETIEFKIELP
jgi:hypothetical protein